MVNGKYIFNVHWPNSLGLIEAFCTVCEQPWVDLNPRLFAQKATTLTTAPRRPHTSYLAEIAYFNSPNRELSKSVQVMALY